MRSLGLGAILAVARHAAGRPDPAAGAAGAARRPRQPPAGAGHAPRHRHPARVLEPHHAGSSRQGPVVSVVLAGGLLLGAGGPLPRHPHRQQLRSRRCRRTRDGRHGFELLTRFQGGVVTTPIAIEAAGRDEPRRQRPRPLVDAWRPTRPIADVTAMPVPDETVWWSSRPPRLLDPSTDAGRADAVERLRDEFVPPRSATSDADGLRRRRRRLRHRLRRRSSTAGRRRSSRSCWR